MKRREKETKRFYLLLTIFHIFLICVASISVYLFFSKSSQTIQAYEESYQAPKIEPIPQVESQSSIEPQLNITQIIEPPVKTIIVDSLSNTSVSYENTSVSYKNPTYNEAIIFVYLDKTDLNEYSQNYTCGCFAMDFKNNSLRAGYRCGVVIVVFSVMGHMIDCFNTTDRGLIFIEPQTDKIVTLTIGQPYWNRLEYQAPEYNDTILRLIIIWFPEETTP